MADLLPFEDLWPLVASAVATPVPEDVCLAATYRRILLADVHAAEDLPGADVAAMDGWAVRSVDTVGDCRSPLRVVDGDAYAGSAAGSRVEAGTALPIATGGLLPAGADAVAPKELVRCDATGATVLGELAPGAHVRSRGSELRVGSRVSRAGERVGALQLAAMADAGAVRVTVARRPRVAVASTGSELVPAGVEPRPGQVVDSNSLLLAAWAEDLLGTAPELRPRLPDRVDGLAAAFGELLDAADVVVVTGGFSVGDRDLSVGVLEGRLGVTRLVWGVAQAPGRRTYVGRRGSAWVVGLAGRPTAVASGWYTLVRPLLLAMQGAARPQAPLVRARLIDPVDADGVLTRLRFACGVERDGRTWVAPSRGTSGWALGEAAAADLLLVVPPCESQYQAGAELGAIRLR